MFIKNRADKCERFVIKNGPSQVDGKNLSLAFCSLASYELTRLASSLL